MCRIWECLEYCYGRPEMRKICVKEWEQQKSHDIKNAYDPKMLYDLLDNLTEIESAKKDEQYATLLSYYDLSFGVTPIISKLSQVC